MSRRRFLERLSSVGGSALMMAGMSALGFGIDLGRRPRRRSCPAGPRARRWSILGAGVAGLTAAYELSNAGYDVTVLEARELRRRPFARPPARASR